MKFSTLTNKLLAGIILSAIALPSSAAIVTLVGTDVIFSYDDQQTGLSLFGTPMLTGSGNGIFLSPTGFIAQSNNQGLDFTTATINITVESKTNSGFILDNLSVIERGDYLLNGTGASVSASLRTEVQSLTAGLGANSIDIVQTGNLTVPSGNILTDWDLISMNDWSWGGETKINLQIQNNLIADDGEGGFAFIQKKSAGIDIEVNPVPLPAAVWFMGAGLAGLFGFSRRRDNK